MLHKKRKLNLFHIRMGERAEAIQAYYVVGRKSTGDIVARVLIPEDMELKKDDTLIFDFTEEVVQ